MATFNKTGCCNCGQLVDACNCNGASAGTECQFKSGAAEVCGIPEMVDPPTRWFRRRRTNGTMTLSKFLDSVCSGEVTVAAGLECRGKAGTATLKGIEEFSSPSTPPKKYRELTVGGGMDAYNGSGCGTHVARLDWTGACSFDPLTGMVTEGRCYRENGGACQPPGAGTASVPFIVFGWGTAHNAVASCGTPPVGGDYLVQVASQTSYTFSGTGVCVDCPGLQRYVGDATGDLSDEDTESAAVARAKAAIADWTTGGTCADHTSYKAVRTAGFSFTFQVAQTRFVVTSGLVNGSNYEGRIHLGRRTIGSGGAFVDTDAPLIVHFSASGASYTSDWQDLPVEDGYEYKALGVEVFGEIEQLTSDSWDVTEEFSSATCIQSVDDHSVRLVDGSPAAGPFGHTPPDAYGALVDVVTTALARTTSGKDDCQADGAGGYVQANGTVTELLDQQDTVDDAASRAMAGITDWTAGGCGLPAFITARTPGNTVFGFRWMQIRAVLTGIAIPHTYHVTWRTYRRPNGSSLPYVFYSELIQEVTATGPTMDSEWIDVPNEEGWDTIVSGSPKVTVVA